jgi:hypothetical protein
MASWLPLIKVVLPYIGPVVEKALPHLTRKKSDHADPVVSQQIGELQDAVNTNTQSLKALAKAMEESAKANDAAIRQARLMAVVALAVAALAAAVAIAALLRQF